MNDLVEAANKDKNKQTELLEKQLEVLERIDERQKKSDNKALILTLITIAIASLAIHLEFVDKGQLKQTLNLAYDYAVRFL